MQPQQSNFEQAKAVSRQLLSATECNDLIQKLNRELTPIVQKTRENSEYRSVLARDIDINEIPYLKNTVLSANDQLFNFDLYNDTVDCFFAQYSEDMHYDQLHIDCIAGPMQRKLSFSLLLTDDFVGGDFELINPPGIEKLAGKLIVFPSYLPHRVTKVTQGIRYAIFGWFYGPHYR